MILGNRSLNDISIDDILSLVDERVPEGVHLEFKQAMYPNNKRDEMLRDITAFANADGGYLILGIEEDGNDHAKALSPIPEPVKTANSIRQICLSGITERIERLEIQAYETGFNQGVVVIHVPSSDRRPHMVTFEERNEIVRRYERMKLKMTLAELRDLFINNPRYVKPHAADTTIGYNPQIATSLAAEELVTESTASTDVPDLENYGESTIHTSNGPSGIQIVTTRPVEKFLQRFLLSGIASQALVLISPFMSKMENSSYNLSSVIEKVNRDRTRLYVVTQPPKEIYQMETIQMLQKCKYSEIRYNSDVHAKLFIAWNRDETESFGLFGSGNLTEGGLRNNIELGMMILSRGYGKQLLRELYQWSTFGVRSSSERIKAIKL